MLRATSAKAQVALCSLTGLLCVLGVFAALPPLASAADHSRASLKLDEIIRAMEANGERAGAVAIHWREVVHFAKAGLMAPEELGFLGVDGEVSKTGIPARDVQAAYPGDLLLKGTWMKVSTKTGGPGSTEKEVMSDSTTAYDGVENRYLSANAHRGLLYGGIVTDTRNRATGEARFLPLLMYLRPFAEPFHLLDKRALRVKTADTIVNNQHCVVISDGHMSAWLDPARACIPLVLELHRTNGETSMRAEVEYAEDKVLYWVPKRYRVSLYDMPHPSKVNIYYEVSSIVLRPQLSLAQRDFALVFPPGTDVYDGRDETRYRVGPDGRKISLGSESCQSLMDNHDLIAVCAKILRSGVGLPLRL